MKLPILLYLALFSCAIPVAAGFLRIRLHDRSMRLLLVLFILGLVNSVLQYQLAIRGIHNLFLAHIFLFVEFLLFVWVFSSWTDGAFSTLLRRTFFLFIVFWVLSHLFLEKFDEPAYYTSLSSKIIYTGVAIFMLHRISAGSEVSILRDSRFWFLAGVLIYGSSGILFASLRSVIDKLPMEGFLVAISANWVVTIITNVLYAIGFLCKPQARNSGGQLELAP